MADSRGRVQQHRFVMAEHLGRPLTKYEIVHHDDEDERNNDISNLVLTTLSDHTRHHLHANPAPMIDIECDWCGGAISKLKRKAFKNKMGRHFCNQSHGALFQQREARGGLVEIPHGRYGRYLKGCRCELCRRSNANKKQKERLLKKSLGG
jgi:hypothetical protein